MSDISRPAAQAARQAGPASGGTAYSPFICANVRSSITLGPDRARGSPQAAGTGSFPIHGKRLPCFPAASKTTPPGKTAAPGPAVGVVTVSHPWLHQVPSGDGEDPHGGINLRFEPSPAAPHRRCVGKARRNPLPAQPQAATCVLDPAQSGHALACSPDSGFSGRRGLFSILHFPWLRRSSSGANMTFSRTDPIIVVPLWQCWRPGGDGT